MRLAKPSLITQLTHTPLPSATFLHLPHLRIEHLSTSLHSATNLISLTLHNNAIRSLSNDELKYCTKLYSLDLSNNLLESLDGICNFACFGELNLKDNRLSFDELCKLSNLHVVCLNLINNVSMKGSKIGTREYRQQVLRRCPNVWVLDGVFVSKAERVEAIENRIETNEVSSGAAIGDGVNQLAPHVSSPGHWFMKEMSIAPTKNQDSISSYRLKFLLLHADSHALRNNTAESTQVHKPKPTR